MKRPLQIPFHSSKATAILTTLILATVVRASLANISELSVPEKNLAANSSGARIECTTPDGRVAVVPTVVGANKNVTALQTGEETLSCPLEEGETTFVIKLPATSMLDRFTFVNENAAAAGELKIAVSNYQLPATSPKWTEVDGNIAFSHKRLFNLSIVGIEARYMKLSFNVAKGGRINSLGLYGGGRGTAMPASRAVENHQFGWISHVNSAPEKQSKPARKNNREIDFAAQKAKARVVYVSSNTSPSSALMIDDNNKTAFHFASTDARPTAIVELSQTERIHRVTALYKMHAAGRLDVYLLNDISKSATDINYQKPVASTTEQNDQGEAAVDFDPEGARYVAIRFTPSDSLSAGQDFAIAEINAYGDLPMAMIDALEAPDVYASNFTGATFAGEGITEISSGLGTLAIPPAVPEVSP